MRLHMILFALSLAMLPVASAVAADNQLVEEIKAARLALDTAFAEQDVETIKSMVTPDHVGVTSYYYGPFSTQEEIVTLSKLKVDYFNFSNTIVDVLGDDAAMITFEARQSGTFDGKPLPTRIAVVEIWTRSAGTWLQKYYQETPIAD